MKERKKFAHLKSLKKGVGSGGGSGSEARSISQRIRTIKNGRKHKYFYTFWMFSYELRIPFWRGTVRSLHGLINYIDTKAKFRHRNKFTCTWTLQQVFICLRPSSHTLPPPPPRHRIRVYCILAHTGEGGELTREKVRGTTVRTVSPVYKLW